jgi:hypothetical protein
METMNTNVGSMWVNMVPSVFSFGASENVPVVRRAFSCYIVPLHHCIFIIAFWPYQYHQLTMWYDQATWPNDDHGISRYLFLIYIWWLLSHLIWPTIAAASSPCVWLFSDTRLWNREILEKEILLSTKLRPVFFLCKPVPGDLGVCFSHSGAFQSSGFGIDS